MVNITITYMQATLKRAQRKEILGKCSGVFSKQYYNFFQCQGEKRRPRHPTASKKKQKKNKLTALTTWSSRVRGRVDQEEAGRSCGGHDPLLLALTPDTIWKQRFA